MKTHENLVVVKPILTSFKKNNYEYRQIKRVGNYSIYEQSYFDNITKKTVKYYEVIIIRIIPGTEMFKTENMLVELYPSTCDWGRFAKTTTSLEKANSYLDKLVLNNSKSFNMN